MMSSGLPGLILSLANAANLKVQVCQVKNLEFFPFSDSFVNIVPFMIIVFAVDIRLYLSLLTGIVVEKELIFVFVIFPELSISSMSPGATMIPAD